MTWDPQIQFGLWIYVTQSAPTFWHSLPQKMSYWDRRHAEFIKTSHFPDIRFKNRFKMKIAAKFDTKQV